MTDPELRRTLDALHPPAPSDAARSRALFRATLALDAAARSPAPVAERRSRFVQFPRLPVFRSFPAFPALASIAAAAVLLLAPFALLRPTPPTRSPARVATATTHAATLLAELETLFPGQLNAVIDREGTLQLDLSDNASSASPATSGSATPSPADQALLVELVRPDGRRLRVLSYSGRSVDIELDGIRHRFEALLDGAGDIVLAGPDFVWTPSAPRRLAGWSVNARALSPVL